MRAGGAQRWRAGGAKRFGDVMKRLLKAKRFYEKSRYGALVSAWEEAVGGEIASHTRISSYEHGRLSIEVDSSVLLHELAGFMRDMLLKELRGKPAAQDVVDLRFRLAGGGARQEDHSAP